MVNRPRTRKRVCAVRRAPDGSAFKKCHRCGVSVAVALTDLHDCGDNKREVKRFRGICSSPNVEKPKSFSDQPRSPFCFFMESLMKNCTDGSSFDIVRKGFETWKNMSSKEREPYVSQAKLVDAAYIKSLNEEASGLYKVDDEADSATVGKFDKVCCEDCEPTDQSGGSD